MELSLFVGHTAASHTHTLSCQRTSFDLPPVYLPLLLARALFSNCFVVVRHLHASTLGIEGRQLFFDEMPPRRLLPAALLV